MTSSSEISIKSTRYNSVIQNILENTVVNFERKVLHHSITAKEYWKKFFEISDLGNNIYTELKRIHGEKDKYKGFCSTYVVTILQNFDEFKLNNPELHFPVRNLGRCRINGYNNTGANCNIPYYNLFTNEFLDWKYHEVIVVIDDEDLVNDGDESPLISATMIYSIGMNRLNLLKLKPFIKDLVPVAMINMFRPGVEIPDHLIFNITHRYTDLLDTIDKWRNLDNKICKMDKRWYT